MLINYLSLYLLVLISLPITEFSQRKPEQIILPIRVKTALNNYLLCLKTKKFDNCEKKITKIAGGGLLKPNDTKLREEVINISLKNDFEKVKNYFYPPKITKITKRFSKGIGFGTNKLSGTVYKIWIKNLNGTDAPISFIQTTDKKVKLIGIGSL